MNDINDFELLHRLFQKNLLLRTKLREIVRSIANLEKNMCLEITCSTPILSYYLRKAGGKWHTAVSEKEHALFEKCLGENVHVFTQNELPFKRNTFDIIVLIDVLERVQSDVDFVEQCHKLLKSEGFLIVHTRQVKRRSLLNFLRRILGVRQNDTVRPGYTESELFRVLRDGFNMREVKTYSHFFVETVDTVGRAIVERRKKLGNITNEELLKFYRIINIFYLLAAQFDLFLFFTKGNYIVATAQRRAWRPRRAPVLIDGRSIVDAVLSKPGV
jgi:cyclopropane fatty-acyl-phospholipid synthase-like methyltransferase